MVQHATALRDDAERLPASAASPVDGSRLGVYAALGASVAVVPLPWIPDALARRVRGALVHDVAVRRGLSLTPEARAILADPSGPEGPRGLASEALHFFGAKLAARVLAGFGPVRAVWPAQSALRTFVLGRMFDRYLARARTERAVRVGADEARLVRRAIDGAIARAMSVQPPPTEEPAAIDDQRDPTTMLVDGILSVAAGMPERLLRRLDAAFDELLAQSAHG
jgi:hypothetical protein